MMMAVVYCGSRAGTMMSIPFSEHAAWPSKPLHMYRSVLTGIVGMQGYWSRTTMAGVVVSTPLPPTPPLHPPYTL